MGKVLVETFVKFVSFVYFISHKVSTIQVTCLHDRGARPLRCNSLFPCTSIVSVWCYLHSSEFMFATRALVH